MNKKVYIFIFFVLIFINNKSQDLPLHSLYLHNNFLINPALAGNNESLLIKLVNRKQWVGVPGAPLISVLSHHRRINNMGVGGYLFNDKGGVFSRSGAQFTYAYHIKKVNDLVTGRKTQYSFGISLLGEQTRLDLADMESSSADATLSKNDSYINFDSNIGFFIEHNFMYAGISVANIIPNINKISSNKFEPNEDRNFFIITGHTLKLSKNYNLSPSMVIKTTDKLRKQVDINIKLSYDLRPIYDHLYWVGFSARHNSRTDENSTFTVLPIIGGKYKRFYFSYAFEYTPLGNELNTGGTHEVTIAFDITNKKCRFCNFDR